VIKRNTDLSQHRILITGINGMIGTALRKRFQRTHFDVYGIDIEPSKWNFDTKADVLELDLCNPNVEPDFLGDIDSIIHAAANARVSKLVGNPEMAHENIQMTRTVLEWARKYNIPNVLFLSSREVYGNQKQTIAAEEHVTLDTIESPYAASKLSAEALLRSYANCYDINWSVLRLSNVYGRYDAKDRVVPLFLSNAYFGEPLKIYGDEKILDFTYIEDVIQGILKCIFEFPTASGEVFNIASGKGSSLRNLAEMLLSKTDSDSDIVVKSERKGEVERFVADITKAKKLLSYTPQMDLETGLEPTIDWYMNRPSILEGVQNR